MTTEAENIAEITDPVIDGDLLHTREKILRETLEAVETIIGQVKTEIKESAMNHAPQSGYRLPDMIGKAQKRTLTEKKEKPQTNRILLIVYVNKISVVAYT